MGANKLLWGWDSAAGEWRPVLVDATGNLLVDLSGVSLGDLGDVNLAGLANQNLIWWNAVAGEWQVVTPGGLAGVINLDDLADVNLAGLAAGDLIWWNAVAGEWQVVTPGGLAGVINLDDLADVNAPAPAADDVLTWDNVAGEWIPAPAAPVGGATLIATLTNKAGAATVVGYVYRLDPDNNDSFDYAAEDEDAQVVVATAVIADNAAGAVALAGYIDVYVNATTTRGQFLYFSGTSGQAKPSWYRNDGAFAQAVASRAGAGLVKGYVFERERIEKYSTNNESSLSNLVPLPFIGTTEVGWTFVDGPGTLGCVIDVGGGGSWDDKYIQRMSAVIKMPDGRYVMAYSGGTAANPTNGIGLVTCPGRPFTVWTKGAHNPIIAVGGVWRSTHVYQPALSLDLANNRLHLWYLGTNNADAEVNVKVGHAYCAANVDYTDDANWTNDENQYQPHGGAVRGLSVLRVGNCYLHFIAQVAGPTCVWRISTATGIPVDYGDILTVGAPGSWDNLLVGMPSVLFESGIYICVYVGFAGGAAYYSNGMATAVGTPFQTFTKWAGNLVGSIIPLQALKYNAVYNLQAIMFRENRTFYLLGVGRVTAAGTYDRVGLWKMAL